MNLDVNRLRTSMTPAPDRRLGRLERLRALAARQGTLRLDEAARSLGVSTMTLRRDLAQGDAGLSLLGGHVVDRRGLGADGYTLADEQGAHPSAKAEAGRRAAALVEPGDTIFIDCGTTMPHVMAALPIDIPVTIVCYALNIAQSASRMPQSTLFLLGGLFHPASATFYAEDALRGLKRLGINKAFLSAGGLHDVHGASCSHFTEVPVKQAVLQRAVRSFLVIDTSKRGVVKPARFAAADAFERVITEDA
jgi:DeoR family deoxyribose operon repressor